MALKIIFYMTGLKLLLAGEISYKIFVICGYTLETKEASNETIWL